MTKPEVKVLIETLKSEGITNQGVLEAIRSVPRELFVLESSLDNAYENIALPIDCQQTISQPYIVAHMTQILLGTKNKINKILEIGTGSGYQTAILCQVAKQIYTIERIEALYTQAKNLLIQLHYKHIHFRYGDGYLGWPEAAPFDAIMVTAATPVIPKALLEQLSKENGRMIIPVGDLKKQNLIVITRNGDDYSQESIEAVRFVPLKPGLE